MADPFITDRLRRWRSWLDAGPLYPANEVEKLVDRAGDESAMVELIRRTVDPNEARQRLATVDFYNQVGEAEKAAAELDSLDREHGFVRERIVIALAQTGLKGNVQRKDAGSKSKRRQWAVVLAEHIKSWDDIPESREPLSIETTEIDFRFYRDGKEELGKYKEWVCAADASTDEAIGIMARSTFEKRYLKKTGQKRR